MLNKFGFSKHLRVRTKAQYQQVFGERQRIFTPYYIVYHRDNQETHGRLGIVVSKRNARSAVTRNKVKRVAREWFRLQQDALKGIDLVLVARSHAAKATHEELHQCLEKLTSKLLKCYKPSLSD